MINDNKFGKWFHLKRDFQTFNIAREKMKLNKWTDFLVSNPQEDDYKKA